MPSLFIFERQKKKKARSVYRTCSKGLALNCVTLMLFLHLRQAIKLRCQLLAAFFLKAKILNLCLYCNHVHYVCSVCLGKSDVTAPASVCPSSAHYFPVPHLVSLL